MNVESQIFDFELDFAGTLRCIPMIVRFKLDQCGVKLSLRQWSKLSHDDREQLVKRPTESVEDIRTYKLYLIDLIESRAKDKAQDVVIDHDPVWSNLQLVPERLCRYATNLGVDPPSIEKWSALSALERFALFKLTRPGHDNDNFIPAMREFELMS